MENSNSFKFYNFDKGSSNPSRLVNAFPLLLNILIKIRILIKNIKLLNIEGKVLQIYQIFKYIFIKKVNSTQSIQSIFLKKY